MLPEAIHRDTSLLAAIRQQTASLHQQLERKVDLTVPWTRARYAAFLRATLAVVEPTEPLLRRHLGEGRFPLLVTAVARLRHDLDSILADRPRPIPVRLVATEAEALGAAYVFLGSLLGGRVIARVIEPQLSLTSSQLTYLRPPDDVRAAWRSYLAALGDWSRTATPVMRAAAIDTALHVFGAFERSFAAEGFA